MFRNEPIPSYDSQLLFIAVIHLKNPSVMHACMCVHLLIFIGKASEYDQRFSLAPESLESHIHS